MAEQYTWPAQPRTLVDRLLGEPDGPEGGVLVRILGLTVSLLVVIGALTVLLTAGWRRFFIG